MIVRSITIIVRQTLLPMHLVEKLQASSLAVSHCPMLEELDPSEVGLAVEDVLTMSDPS